MQESIEDKALRLLKQYSEISAYKIQNATKITAQTICNYRNGVTKPNKFVAEKLVSYLESLNSEESTASEDAPSYYDEKIKDLELEIAHLKEENQMLINTINILTSKCAQPQN